MQPKRDTAQLQHYRSVQECRQAGLVPGTRVRGVFVRGIVCIAHELRHTLAMVAALVDHHRERVSDSLAAQHRLCDRFRRSQEIRILLLVRLPRLSGKACVAVRISLDASRKKSA